MRPPRWAIVRILFPAHCPAPKAIKSSCFMLDIKTAGIISKPGIPHATTIVPQLVEWLKAHGIGSRYDIETAKYLGRVDGLARPEVAEGADLLIVLGGDGTLLSAA